MSDDQSINGALEDYVDKRDLAENRRFAVVQALSFFKNTARGVISAEAVLHGADLFFQYVQNGKVPDIERARQATEDFTKTLVQGAFPATFLNSGDSE